MNFVKQKVLKTRLIKSTFNTLSNRSIGLLAHFSCQYLRSRYFINFCQKSASVLSQSFHFLHSQCPSRMTRRNYKYAVISYRESLALSGGKQAYKSTFWPMIYYLIYKVFLLFHSNCSGSKKICYKTWRCYFFILFVLHATVLTSNKHKKIVFVYRTNSEPGRIYFSIFSTVFLRAVQKENKLFCCAILFLIIPSISPQLISTTKRL